MNELLEKISKYNFWDGKLPPLGFERKGYLNMIMQYTGNRGIPRRHPAIRL